MNTKSLCPECGAELAPGDAKGLCPRCLFQHGLGTQPEPGTLVVGNASPVRRPLPEPGEPFGNYLVIRPLGRGGMGVVYEAQEVDTGRRVALKVLGQQLDSPDHRARFLREGRLAASINHPNSVYVFGTEEIDGTPTIAMELVAGGTLDQRVRKRGPLPVAAAVDAIFQIIAGLEAAQAIGILHRDVKPGNCFEDTDGTVKIGDFGLSISTAARADSAITAAGTMVGTPAFCSPEQLRGEELSARSDMYSVGVTLYYLLTGHVPFEGHNLAQLTANVLEKRPPSPRVLRKETPAGLASVVLRCLEKQPGERFKSYAELRQALAPYTSVAPTPATLGLRFLAGLADMVLLGLIGSILVFSAFGNPMGFLTLDRLEVGHRLAWMAGGLLLGMLYYAVGEGLWGVTLGKRLCRLRVIGPDNSPPGIWRASVRMFFYMVLPSAPYWIVSRGDPFAFIGSNTGVQYALQFSFYVVLALLFSTMRRRNGFAAVHDLITKTRVIARAAPQVRPTLVVGENAPAAVDGKPQVGPYHVIETFGTDGEAEWLLGYDLRLLRKVWIRTVPPGTPAVPSSWRSLGRVGRLRWLTGRRSPEENWDAFEGVSGRPLLQLVAPPIAQPQPWSQVRFWLHDLASEIAAAGKDGTLPLVLSLDRVWITGEGRAKLLDFPAPGLESAHRNPNPTVAVVSSVIRPGDTEPPRLGPSRAELQRFLHEVTTAALAGQPQARGEARLPLPLHARDFLQRLPQFPDANAAVAALAPLLSRITTVSRARRVAIVAGCLAFPVFCGIMMKVGMTMLDDWSKRYPGLMELNTLLQQRHFFPSERRPSDPQYAVYIATHYSPLITNEAAWSSPFARLMIKGEDRQFAEQSVAQHGASTKQEIAAAETALKPYVRTLTVPAFVKQPGFLFLMVVGSSLIYVAVPALLAALIFRGGLVLRIANVTFVRRDGARASRLRLFWRGLVAWSPLVPAMMFAAFGAAKPTQDAGWWVLTIIVLGGLVIGSLMLPRRGLPDFLAGTWPVPR